jgi:hypothetical protein
VVVGHWRQDVVDLVAGVEEHLPLGRPDLLELGAIGPVDARLLRVHPGEVGMNTAAAVLASAPGRAYAGGRLIFARRGAP